MSSTACGVTVGAPQASVTNAKSADGEMVVILSQVVLAIQAFRSGCHASIWLCDEIPRDDYGYSSILQVWLQRISR